MCQELIEIFLVLSIVNLWINPVVRDLSSIFETHLREFFNEEVALILPIHICWQILLFWLWLLSAHTDKLLLSRFHQISNTLKNYRYQHWRNTVNEVDNVDCSLAWGQPSWSRFTLVQSVVFSFWCCRRLTLFALRSRYCWFQSYLNLCDYSDRFHISLNICDRCLLVRLSCR